MINEENNFIDTLIAEAEADEQKQTLVYFDLIITEVSRLEYEISTNFNNADEEVKIIKEWSLARNSNLQEKVNFLKLKLEHFIREEGKKTIDLPHGTLKMRKMPDRVEITNMEIFLENANQDVVTVIPESVKPDLSKIKTYIRNSGKTFPGVTIIEGKEEFKLTRNNKSKEIQNDNKN